MRTKRAKQLDDAPWASHVCKNHPDICKTLVIDTADWAEMLWHRYVIRTTRAALRSLDGKVLPMSQGGVRTQPPKPACRVVRRAGVNVGPCSPMQDTKV